MKKIVLFIVLSALFAGARAGEPRDWAQYGRYAAQNAAVERPVEAVFMGNSITDNWAAHDSEFFVRNGFVGRGISGQTSIEMLARFRRERLGFIFQDCNLLDTLTALSISSR